MRDETLELIQIGEEAGRAQWVERNPQNLAPIEQIITLLEGGKLHHPAGKGGESTRRRRRLLMAPKSDHERNTRGALTRAAAACS